VRRKLTELPVPAEVINKLDDMTTDKSDFIESEDNIEENATSIEDKLEDALSDEPQIHNDEDLHDDNCFDLHTTDSRELREMNNPDNVGKQEQDQTQSVETENQEQNQDELQVSVSKYRKYNL
jgi:hypothetical protein